MDFLLNLFLFSLILSSTFSSSVKDILSKGSSLSVENPYDVLVSANGLFTAGFHPVGENAYCFAIWYMDTRPSGKCPCFIGHNRTVVWMANRDQPVNGRLSKLSLTKDGNLILTDANLFISWRTDTNSPSARQLVLYNNGNLVLLAAENNVLWQSFDSPTDTLLPGQNLTRSARLVAARSQTNHSSGFYRLFFGDDNILRLVFNGPETSSIYWPDPGALSYQAGRSRYNDTRIAVFDSEGYFKSSDLVEFWAADFGPGLQRRLKLDIDGNLRLYSLENNTGNWVVSWQAISRSCRIHGSCGPNSFCRVELGLGRKCSCLPGFRMNNDTDWSYGCKPEFNLSRANNGFNFLKFPDVDFYGYNIDTMHNFTFERCKMKCLELQNCGGFEYRYNMDLGVYDCYPKWALHNGYSPSNFSSGAFYLKVPKSSTLHIDKSESSKLNCSSQRPMLLNRNYKRKEGSKLVRTLLWLASVLGGIETLCVVSIWLFLHKTQKGSDDDMEQYVQVATGFRKFSYAELKKATKNFSEEIGRGSGGVVYKGMLPDGRIAAIKQLNEANQDEAEFLSEANIIGKLNHMNLIEMLGYCAERKHKLLVYEYAEHGSLAQNLCSNAIDWKKRYEIALGTAKGLSYLHEECLEWVLHCDVKPQNILLDSNYQPKVADFGLSKLLRRSGETNSNFSRVRGTRGYMAPEWIFNLPITSKVDVYSYGIVLLELVTGKSPNTSIHAIGVDEKSLVKWVRDKVDGAAQMTSWIEEVVDPLIHESCEMPKIEQLVRVALQCVEEDKDARPTMRQVIEMLECDEYEY